MHADSAAHEQPCVAFGDIPAHALKGLAVEEGDRQVDAGLGGLRLGHAQMGLVDLGQTAVDDLLVQRLLFLEAEHLRRLLREHVDDAVEDAVVEVGVVHGNRLDSFLQRLAETEGDLQPTERLRRSVDRDDDVALHRSVTGAADDE